MWRALPRDALAVAGEALHFDFAHLLGALDLGDRVSSAMISMPLARTACGSAPVGLARRSTIGRDGHAGGGEIERRLIGAVVVGHDARRAGPVSTP